MNWLHAFAAMALAASAGSVHAQLVVLHDSGKAVPLEPYISYMLAGTDQPGVLAGLRFPLRSGLSRGLLQRDGIRAFDARWLTQSVFVMGTDPHSLNWLEFNQTRLQQLRAWGLVVASGSEHEFKRAQEIAGPIPLAPAISPWMEAQLRRAGVGVYPVLIHANGTVHQRLGALP